MPGSRHRREPTACPPLHLDTASERAENGLQLQEDRRGAAVGTAPAQCSLLGQAGMEKRGRGGRTDGLRL